MVSNSHLGTLYNGVCSVMKKEIILQESIFMKCHFILNDCDVDNMIYQDTKEKILRNFKIYYFNKCIKLYCVPLNLKCEA